ncbi:hypothetical protein ABZ412_12815 [Nocardia sp. NPDC005746]|uniref:hypothetical protein n=1 Tax=Nocardia sp. NPDC005746 TaxID=3157062 RepID=UPI0033D088AD
MTLSRLTAASEASISRAVSMAAIGSLMRRTVMRSPVAAPSLGLPLGSSVPPMLNPASMPCAVRVGRVASARMPTASVGVGTGMAETRDSAGSTSRGETTASAIRTDSRSRA